MYTESNALPTIDFIAGLISVEGAFMWVKQNNTEIPVFQLKMHKSERSLVELVRDGLGLSEKVHAYHHNERDYVLLLVRSKKSIEDIIIPALTGRLLGTRAAQFYLWKEKYFENKFS